MGSGIGDFGVGSLELHKISLAYLVKMYLICMLSAIEGETLRCEISGRAMCV